MSVRYGNVGEACMVITASGEKDLFVARFLAVTRRSASGDQDEEGRAVSPPAVPDHMKGRDLPQGFRLSS